jgi:hypothetical protein
LFWKSAWFARSMVVARVTRSCTVFAEDGCTRRSQHATTSLPGERKSQARRRKSERVWVRHVITLRGVEGGVGGVSASWHTCLVGFTHMFGWAAHVLRGVAVARAHAGDRDRVVGKVEGRCRAADDASCARYHQHGHRRAAQAAQPVRTAPLFDGPVTPHATVHRRPVVSQSAIITTQRTV